MGWQGNSTCYCCKQQAKLQSLFYEFCCYTQNPNAAVLNLSWSGFRLSLGVSLELVMYSLLPTLLLFTM